MEYWATQPLPDGVETPVEVTKRIERVITFLERVKRQVTPGDGKVLRMVCVGHEELFRDLLEASFGIGTAPGTGPTYGESMQLSLRTSPPSGETTVAVRFRDEEATLAFDRVTRALHRRGP
jgi:hypothetical protein